MRGISREFLAAGLAAALAWAAPAGAQVGPIETGRALDANLRIGSSGYNTPVTEGRINSQLYVTGQVTGLARFHGGVGYSAPDQFMMNLPSAALSDFRRRSVNLAQAMRGGTYLTQPYYDRSSTVLGPAAIAARLNAPGSNIPRRSAMALPAAEKLYQDAVSQYQPLMGERPGGAIDARIVGPYRPAIGAYAPASAAQRGWSAIRPGANAIFAVPKAQQRARLVQELNEAQAHGEAQDGRVDSYIDARVDLSVKATPELGTDADETSWMEAAAPGISARRARFLPEPDRDVFVDMLVRMRTRRLDSERAARPWERTEKSQTQPSVAPASDQATQPETQSPRGWTGKLVDMDAQGLVLRSLAGQRNDQFNFHMRRAEKHLREGKSYRAVSEYHLASSYSRTNPLAHVGMALALFSAGEPVSAGKVLEIALETYPPLIETRIDIEKLANMPIIESRLAKLDELRTRREADLDVHRALMGAFVNHNLRRQEEAKAFAGALKGLAGERKVLAACANRLLSDEVRPEATTKPSETSSEQP